jgi:uncharacterized secreted protein with C-terminal beta-propeller domain
MTIALFVSLSGIGQIDTTYVDTTLPSSDNINIKKFNSTQEIQEYIKNNLLTTQQNSWLYDDTSVMPELSFEQSAGISKSTDSPLGTVTGHVTSTDYSTTNIQVAGVDEADFIKNDGKYIYMISNNKLVIVDAYPATGAKIVSETSIDGTAANIFLNGNYLVIFTSAYGNTPIPLYNTVDYVGTSVMPPYKYTPTTHALVYSIKNKNKPVLEKDIKVDGNYFDSRMIGDYVYMITKQSVNYYDNPILVPEVQAGTEKAITPDVYYFSNPEYNYVFHTVTSFNALGGSGVNSKTFLMGSTNTMFVSADNIYISYPVYRQTIVYKPAVNVPQLALSSLEDAYNYLTESEKGSFVSNLTGGKPASTEVDQSRTVIHKISINKGKINYVSKGEVRGNLLNQYSMDEYNGNLRVATTSYVYTNKGSQQFNNVYVLDSGMQTIGSLEHIAPDEKIYSTRFMGDRLYMVTFKQLDPFFVIDLSSPASPKVLGELKLPGYSDYLHPYDATHVIGIGKDTTINEWGGASAKGLKLALFDVSDINNPKLVDKFVIGTSGTSSEALSDHKAFLFDKEKDILAIPVNVVSNDPVIENGYSYIKTSYWNGVYVFSVNPATGFKVKGTVAQDDDTKTGYYGSGSVKRSLYIDNTLYTVSSSKIVMSDLKDLKTRIGEIQLQGSVVSYYDK